MNAPEKARLYKALLSQREQIRLLTNFRGEQRSLSEGVQDMCDLATVSIDSDIADMVDQNESEILDNIDLALERLADGTYGICENCHKQIPVERLRARPAAARCVSCQTEEERQNGFRPRRRVILSF